MKIEYSKHWQKKHDKKRKDISEDVIEYALNNSKIQNDKYWKDALNVISRIPLSGRILKVVYRKAENKILIITAYWLD